MVLFLSIFNYSEMILPLISIFYLNMVFGGGVFWYGAERQNLFGGGTVRSRYGGDGPVDLPTDLDRAVRLDAAFSNPPLRPVFTVSSHL